MGVEGRKGGEVGVEGRERRFYSWHVGDFMKMGADPADRIYEELTDMKKVFNVLSEVSSFSLFLS